MPSVPSLLDFYTFTHRGCPWQPFLLPFGLPKYGRALGPEDELCRGLLPISAQGNGHDPFEKCQLRKPKDKNTTDLSERLH